MTRQILALAVGLLVALVAASGAHAQQQPPGPVIVSLPNGPCFFACSPPLLGGFGAFGGSSGAPNPQTTGVPYPQMPR